MAATNNETIAFCSFPWRPLLHSPESNQPLEKYAADARELIPLQPWPTVITENVRRLTGNVVYETMQGPNELVITGNLKYWDRTDRLGEILQPTLITVGFYDSAVPACASTLLRYLAAARLEIFEQSAHMPHLEEGDAYIRLLRNFLHFVDT